MKSIFDQIRSNRKTRRLWGGYLEGLVCLAGLAWLGGLVAPLPSSAQQPGRPVGSADSLAAQLRATVTADTDGLITEPRDFLRYATPTYCRIAVRHALTVARRSIAAQAGADTARRHPAHDTLPAQVALVARGCTARFQVATAAPTDLPDLFELALLGQQDSLAAAIVARRAALAKGLGARAAVLAEAVDHYLAASPARVAAAEAVVTQLEALGRSVAVLGSRLRAYQRLAQLGDSTGDMARVQHEMAQILTLARTVPGDSLSKVGVGGELITIYQELALSLSVRAPDSVRILAQQLQQDVKTVPGFNKSFARQPLDSVVNLLNPMRDALAAGMVRQPTPPLQADFWFPAPDTLRPGRVTLYVEISHITCYGGYAMPWVLRQRDTGCERMYNLVREWGARYGQAGLDMTLVVPIAPQITGTLLSGPQTSTEAAQNLDWFFRQYLKLPVQHVAVQLIPVTAPLPAPDGRLFPQGSDSGRVTLSYLHIPFDSVYHPEAYRNGNDAGLVLTGRDGRLVYSGGPSLVFDRLLAAVMTVPTVASPATPAPPAASAPPPAPSAPGPAAAPPTAAAHLQPGTV